jgi:UDP-N-acetylglucosamine--N-acetylmuramyl-(pentapeptide) pyrophosphoryl-undecaprenol N-acetylglucosamine transferase
MTRTVLIMAGGTGGHVFPALAVAQSLQQRGVNVEWLGTSRGIEAEKVPAAGLLLHTINISGVRGKGLASLLKAPFQILLAIGQALLIVRKLKPICVLGFGGFVSGPGGLASWLMARPLLIQEQNAIAGTSNRLLASFASKVLTGYPISLGGKKNVYLGNPVREEISRVSAPDQRWADRSGKLRLLVLGGSLGAKPINEVLPPALSRLNKASLPEVWHQAGHDHAEGVKAAYSKVNIEARVEPFIENMAQAYAWADLVICRAGALTIAELTAVGVASILVPLPYAIDDHQTANARWLEQSDAAVVLPQSQMDWKEVAELISGFDGDISRLKRMANAARLLARPDAADAAADLCLEVGHG